eukprot:452860-Amphidinium_carterae.1
MLEDDIVDDQEATNKKIKKLQRAIETVHNRKQRGRTSSHGKGTTSATGHLVPGEAALYSGYRQLPPPGSSSHPGGPR